MTKNEIIERLNEIAAYENDKENGFHCEVVIRDWANYGKDRTYFKIVRTRTNSKHHSEKDYGYYDNKTDTYYPVSSLKYSFGGNSMN